MRVKYLPGKLVQLSNLPFASWGKFIWGWLQRKDSGVVPCVLPESTRILQIPLREFYESYGFFSESKQGIDELSFFLNRLRAGDIIYDIGAFRGAYGVAAKAAFGDDVTVYLFEPIEANLQAIEAISRLNQFQRFEIVPKAVGTGGAIAGNFNRRDTMLRKGDLSDTSVTNELIATSLDAHTEETGATPSIVKLDVDGFEMEVLEGGRKFLGMHKPRLWIEIHPQFLAAQGRRWEEAVELLKMLGYGTLDFYSDYDSPTREISFHMWCEP
jgi:FkbM family methyltransferase